MSQNRWQVPDRHGWQEASNALGGVRSPGLDIVAYRIPVDLEPVEEDGPAGLAVVRPSDQGVPRDLDRERVVQRHAPEEEEQGHGRR